MEDFIFEHPLSDDNKRLLIWLDNREKDLMQLGKELLQRKNKSALVLLAIGIVNRSLSLNYGFATLIRSDNYIAAAHLIRLHLDSYLRFHAARLVTDREEFARRVLKGERIDRMKCKKGNFLKDGYLKEDAARHYPWMKTVYETSSGFIHLSPKHVFTSMKKLEEPTMFETAISKYNKYVPDVSIEEGIKCMITTTDTIITMLKAFLRVLDMNK